MTPTVVDTNVLVVADQRHPQAGPECVQECVTVLQTIRENGLIVVDADGQILDEYLRTLSGGQPGAGATFVHWFFRNQWDPALCEHVPLVVDTDDADEFQHFPPDPDLETFDRDDRKFVAVARGSSYDPSIANATDTDWWLFREPLERNGVRVNFLCPEMMTRSGGGAE